MDYDNGYLYNICWSFERLGKVDMLRYDIFLCFTDGWTLSGLQLKRAGQTAQLMRGLYGCCAALYRTLTKYLTVKFQIIWKSR